MRIYKERRAFLSSASQSGGDEDCKEDELQFHPQSSRFKDKGLMTTRRGHRNRRDVQERLALAPLARFRSQGGQLPRSGGQKLEAPTFFDKATEHSQSKRGNRDVYSKSQRGVTQGGPNLEPVRNNNMQADNQENSHIANFELMDTTIVIYGLSGIMCELETVKSKTPRKFGRSKDASLSTSQSSSLESRNWSASTTSSMDVSATIEGMLIENDLNPTTALVSLTTHTISSDTAYETFLASIPLHRPSISRSKAKYTALWSAFLNDDASRKTRENSSFEVVRCMQESNNENSAGTLGSKYVHETVELQLNLSRGTEMIRLGSASLVLSGEEEVEVRTNIPTKRAEDSKQISMQKLKRKPKSANNYGYFSDDLTRRYFLDENATLRIGVQAISQAAKEMAAERQRMLEKMEREKQRKETKQANRHKELRERMERVTMENTKRRLQMKKQIVFSEFDDESEKLADGRKQVHSAETSQDFLPRSLLCSMPAMLCSSRPHTVVVAKEAKAQMPLDEVALPDDYGYQSMQSTRLSSVSYATYDSQFESDSSEWESGIESYYSDQGYSF